jgi:Terminase large subunit, T4likevirus-type, N-terminal
MIGADLARSLDPARWLSDAGYTPDDWQERALRSPSRRKLWNVHRQGGKTLTAAAKALDKATGEPGSLVICVSPSQRQSSEWLRGVLHLYGRHKNTPPILAESAHRLEFAGGSRILSLPSSEATIRGYSKVALLILDEASRIEDATINACRPMLALGGEGGGEIVALSTPWGRRGAFFEWWAHGADLWEREEVKIDACTRIDPDFLKDELKSMGPLLFSQEYQCAFVDNDLQIFSSAMIEACFTDEVTPLWG